MSPHLDSAYDFLALPAARNTGHLRLLRNLQQVSHSLETLKGRLETLVTVSESHNL